MAMDTLGLGAENVQIVVVKAPSMHKNIGFAWLPQRIAVWQSQLLNEATRRLCSRLDYVSRCARTPDPGDPSRFMHGEPFEKRAQNWGYRPDVTASQDG
jgi:hypothetical protein